jgi:hypothetical protein
MRKGTFIYSHPVQGDREGVFELAVKLKKKIIRQFATLQPDMFCWFI